MDKKIDIAISLANNPNRAVPIRIEPKIWEDLEYIGKVVKRATEILIKDLDGEN